MVKIPKTAKTGEKVNPLAAMRNFLQEVGQEQKKIVWPTREAMIQATMVVLVIIVALTIYLGVVDMACRYIFGLLT